VNTLYCYKNGGANREFHPQGITASPGDKIHPWGTAKPLGAKLALRGEVKNGPLVITGRYVHVIISNSLLKRGRNRFWSPFG
jgi:hypothetical protein